MAKRRGSSKPPPARLLTFAPEQWPGPTVEGVEFDAWVRWREARREWHDVHGWPGGEAGWVAAEQEAWSLAPDVPWDDEKI